MHIMDKDISRKIMTVGLALLLLMGCEAPLEEEAFSTFQPEQFFKTSADAEAALTAVYGRLAGIYSFDGWMIPEFSGDQMFPRAVVTREYFTVFSYDETHNFLNTIWTQPYAGIAHANLLIANISGIVMPETRKKEIEGEARFMRALYYFILVKNFGDVPLSLEPVTTPSEVNKSKSSRAEIYQAIFSDLEFAAGALAIKPAVRGRASGGAALGLLAKAYLYAERWREAAATAETLINSNAYRLIGERSGESVEDLWNVDKEDANREEVIFATEFSREPNLRSSDFVSLLAPAGSAPKFSPVSFGSAFAYISFYKSFGATDKRRLSMDTSYTRVNGTYVGQKTADGTLRDRAFIRKYQDPKGPAAGRYEPNFPLLRFADVLLIHAEAAARADNNPTAEAYRSINRVRVRAGLGELTPDLGLNTFVEAVLQERSWELCFEADRWYDLTRTGKFLEVANVTNSYYPSRPVQSKHRWFPIPQSELRTNSLITPTEGWGN